MRILHTSDWHIGRTFHGHSTLEALRGVLEALVVQVREQDVDVVVVAGDVFDSATPAAPAYTLLSEVLAALHATGAQVIVTSGNHDSAARLGFQAGLLREGIHVVTDPETGEDRTDDDLARGVLKIHVDRAKTAQRELHLLQRFISANPSVPWVGVPALPFEVADSEALRAVAEQITSPG